MKLKFPEQLVGRVVTYFHNKHNQNITREEAEEYLDSLADLYLSFHSIKNNKK